MAKKRIITNPNLVVEDIDGKLNLKVKDGNTTRNVSLASNSSGGGIETAVFVVDDPFAEEPVVTCNKSYNEIKNCIVSNIPIIGYMVGENGQEKDILLSANYVYTSGDSSKPGVDENITFLFGNGVISIIYKVDGTILFSVENPFNGNNENPLNGDDGVGKVNPN